MSTPDDALARLGLRGDGIPEGHPDRDLLRLVRVATDLDCQREDAWANWNVRPARRRGTRKEAGEVFRRIADEYSALENKLISTRATTIDGARAKLRFVLRHSDYDQDPADPHPKGGTMMCLPLSAMRDALAMLGGA